VGTYLPERLPEHNHYFVTENPFTAWAGKLIQADGAGAIEIVHNIPPEPWVIFYHSMITHFPYNAEGREYKDAYKTSDPDALRPLLHLYMAGVERIVGTFLDLERILSPDVAILTSDHGDGFLEHGFFGHPAGRMFPTLLHVPLIVRDGGRKYTYKQPISMINFPSLVVAQAEKGKRTRAVAGEECYSAGYRDLHARVASIRKDDDLVIASAVRKPYLYDLSKDPQALKPISGASLPFEPVLNEVSAVTIGKAIRDVTDDDELIRQRLEALGYV
jgi:hypothetical protein